VDRYLAALEREAALHPGFRPRTLYVGGGTPTELDPRQLGTLLRFLSGAFGDLAALREATVEASPENTDEAKLEVLRRAGIGRLSFGLQTAEDRLLRDIGRKHTFADFERLCRRASALGFSVNVDLMLGLPGQTLEDARRSLDRTLELDPDHFSVYPLRVEDRTLFAKRAVRADEDLEREMMEGAAARLASAGYRHYEISNYAKPGRESRHNVNYWLDGPYLGLGCGAAGHLRGLRTQNEDRLSSYLERVEKGELPVRYSERLRGKEKLGETLLLGLRLLDGVRPTEAARAAFDPAFARLARRGLVEPGTGGRLRLTREGVFLANQAFQEFVPPFQPEDKP